MKAVVTFTIDPAFDKEKRTKIVIVTEGKNLLQAQAIAGMRFCSSHTKEMEPEAVIGINSIPLVERESPTIAESPKVSESPSKGVSPDADLWDDGSNEGHYYREG